jgi:indole-3-glycerol phosphate synthase
MDILSQIVDYKKSVIASAKTGLAIKNMQTHTQARGFTSTIVEKVQKKQTAIIAEVKKGSPSMGVISPNLDVAQTVEMYEKGGASCLSILTDEKFFCGSNENLRIATKHSALPILRKDFIIDEYQIYESKHIGADAILLIASILTPKQMQEFEAIATELKMDVLVEVHDAKEMEIALENTTTPLIGVNNRNLRDFSINFENTKNLIKMLPQNRIMVCESGIQTNGDIKTMNECGCYAFLIGTAIMKSENPQSFLENLLV